MLGACIIDKNYNFQVKPSYLAFLSWLAGLMKKKKTQGGGINQHLYTSLAYKTFIVYVLLILPWPHAVSDRRGLVQCCNPLPSQLATRPNLTFITVERGVGVKGTIPPPPIPEQITFSGDFFKPFPLYRVGINLNFFRTNSSLHNPTPPPKQKTLYTNHARRKPFS